MLEHSCLKIGINKYYLIQSSSQSCLFYTITVDAEHGQHHYANHDPVCGVPGTHSERGRPRTPDSAPRKVHHVEIRLQHATQL